MKKRDRIYNTWKGMKSRCYNLESRDFKNYGGRGIRICDKWLETELFQTSGSPCQRGFQNFVDDMESTWFLGATIDRIDNDGNYCPENCQWLTHSQNTTKRNLEKVSDRTLILLGGEQQKAGWTKKRKKAWSERMKVEMKERMIGNDYAKASKGTVSCFDIIIQKFQRVPKKDFDKERGIRYFGPTSKVAIEFKMREV